MAASLDDFGCWLPTHILAGEEKLNPDESVDWDANLCFPTEFPYEVDSPVESSTETDSSSDDGDDFLAGLTRRFAQSSLQGPLNLAGEGFPDKPEKQRISGGSPQSTLNGIGCWSGRNTGRVSPPATPFGFSNDTWGLIYAAAGEVARLKMNRQNRGLLCPQSLSGAGAGVDSHQTRSPNLPQANHYSQFHQFHKHDRAVAPPCPADYGRQVKSPWPTHHLIYNDFQQNRPVMRPGFAGGKPAPAKRESAGTGVFLPRRYTIPSECPNKTGRTPVLVPAKVVQALNLNFNGHAQPRAADLAPDHEAMIARRNALFLRQRGLMAAPEAREVRLPQEWTY